MRTSHLRGLIIRISDRYDKPITLLLTANFLWLKYYLQGILWDFVYAMKLDKIILFKFGDAPFDSLYFRCGWCNMQRVSFAKHVVI
ncbi:hypothetical protein HYN46_00145 [Aquirhabdus parva]|uniref:Uncharacterized protein n=1 Tax=Aquirhabdus parva TaxID=2283318 RepID=A0A345P2D9_9GAMM|nr:hypothetical protein HYN46_00145 [Aquirhabdus parva]